MMRLRRLFSRIGDRQIGLFKMRITDEVCRELLWFLDRFPLEVVEGMDVLVQGADAFKRQSEQFAAVIDGKAEPRPFTLALPARHYQSVAAELGLLVKGLLIADEVGLGKTVMSIAMLTDPATRPALICTLTHLPRQWTREIEKFAPSLRVHTVQVGTPYDITLGQKKRRRQMDLIPEAFPDVILINYHKLSGWAEWLLGKVKSVVFDEVQELRHSGSKKYAAAQYIAAGCTYRIGLSATPIHNYGSEFWNVLDVVKPGALGTRSEFLTEWCSGADPHDPGDPKADPKASIKDPKAFGAYLRENGLMLRRTRSEVGRELPPVSSSIIHIDCNEAEIEKIASDAIELAKLILSGGAAWSELGQATRDLDWKLRHATGVAKAPYVAGFVRLLVEQGEKVVLYGWHREVYSIWLELLDDLNPVMFTGSESETKKDESVHRFCHGDSQVLIISLRAGAGLDGLQHHCRTVVNGELDWSPAVLEQNAGRVARDGQNDPVMVYYLVTDTGSDPVLMDVLGLKKEQLVGVLDPDAKILTTRKADGAKRLAAEFLRQRGIEPPVEVAPDGIPVEDRDFWLDGESSSSAGDA